ncbi:MAG: peptide MFS transporter [Prevotellaceae bacterium]|nr:peptide MFS transporter [Prevotellaceae bacterium]MDD5992097.1 peptide MFS transporter [Prevotellaceae bacterium]
MFEGQPKGLWTLALANTGERFGYYTMLAVFALFLGENFGFAAGTASEIYTWFLTLVYFLPLFGGMAADKWGYSRMVVIGIFVMFLGYLLLSIPLGGGTVAAAAMGAALILVSLGTGMFKGNLQVMVGDLYNDARYAEKRDAGFSLFYMLINVGALFAPTAAIKIMDWAQVSLGYSKADSYHFAFAVACVSVIASILIYYLGKSTFKQVLTVKKEKKAVDEPVEEMSPAETRERIICLVLVFAVVIFFWMAFHQNGLTLTWFADEFTATKSSGVESMAFDVTNLVACIFLVYGIFGIFQSVTAKAKTINGLVLVAGLLILGYNYVNLDAEISLSAPIFQQFNACFVVMLTPVSIALFSWLAKKGKEPKAPVKIGLGMLVAGAAYLLMTVSSIGLPATDHPNHVADVTPNLLITTYLILTFAELLLSPIGISLVTKVAPPKYKGMMMGGWFVATALGNKLVSIPGHMWGLDLTIVWGTLMCICLVAALFIFSIIKKLNKVC